MRDTRQKGLYEKIQIGDTTLQLQERLWKRKNAEKYVSQLQEADPSRKYEMEVYDEDLDLASVKVSAANGDFMGYL